jgi:hypothetical protein
MTAIAPAARAAGAALSLWSSSSSTIIHLPCNALKNARLHLFRRQNRPQIPLKSQKQKQSPQVIESQQARARKETT